MKLKKLIYTIGIIQILTIILLLAYILHNEKQRQDIGKYLILHPELITNLIDMNPDSFTASIKNAQIATLPLLTDDQKIQLTKVKATNYESTLYESDIILYPKNKEQIIVYTDFECSFCRGQFKILQEYANISFVIRPVSLASHKKGQLLSLIFLYVNYYHKDKLESFYKTFFENQDQFLLLSQSDIFTKVSQILGDNITLDKLLKDKKINLHLAFIKNEAKAIHLDSVPTLHVKNHVSSGLTSKAVLDSILSSEITK